jgi:hypothetical protein
MRTGASNGDDDVAAGGGSGNSWRVRRRAAGEGNRAGEGRGRRVGVIPAGGGAVAVAERRPGVKHCAGGRGRQSRARARGRRREGRGPGDLFGNLKNFRDLLVKKDFLLI